MGEGVLTLPFPRVDGELRCGDFPVADLARRYGTPLYVYDAQRIEDRVVAFRDAFGPVEHLLAYSIKANSNLSILRRLAALGCGADITSYGELFRARRAGIPAERIVFSGVGKTGEELREALRAGIYSFNVESQGELERLDAVATELRLRARFALRVNPDVLSPTSHEYIATGHAATKFGVPIADAIALYHWAAGRPHLRACGVDVHVGSQIMNPGPYVEALDKVLAVTSRLAMDGIELEFLDIGGGFGVPYDSEPELSLPDLAREVIPRVKEADLHLVLEPGRAFVADAGILLTRVEYVKRTEKAFVIVDAGMSDLIRPSLYDAFHAIERVDTREQRSEELVDVVGPICETGDFFARNRMLAVPEPGDLLALRTVGAYGFSMSSNYNGRLRPAECLVDGDRVELIRRRDTLDDLIRGEEVPGDEA